MNNLLKKSSSKQNISLHQELKAYGKSGCYPFHMPGHKRQLTGFGDPWQLDITEIDGFDNLHHATGILEQLQQQAAELFGSRRSFLLVNGSTCGLLAAISACIPIGGKLLMSRNCHKAVYHALELRSLRPVYLMPERSRLGIMGSLSPDAVEAALDADPEIGAVLVVSPTYDGVVSDIRAIAALSHSRGIPLIVDEAHGAHFPLSSHFPASALRCGADVVVGSLHKTLPAFTQTAVLHVNSDLVSEDAVRRFLGIYQTSSPSYLLMASADCCLQLIAREGPKRFGELRTRLDTFYQEMSRLSYMECLKPLDTFAWDDSKILLSGQRLGLSGPSLARLLREHYRLEMEMASGHYVLALSSLMDTEEGFQRLYEACAEIERQFSLNPTPVLADMIDRSDIYRLPMAACSIAGAMQQPCRTIPLEEAAGQVSQEYLYLYPPGIPLIVPGEYIYPDLLSLILELRAADLELNGLSDMTNQRINIVIS